MENGRQTEKASKKETKKAWELCGDRDTQTQRERETDWQREEENE